LLMRTPATRFSPANPPILANSSTKDPTGLGLTFDINVSKRSEHLSKRVCVGISSEPVTHGALR
jgi:hypothetical protein